MNLYPIHDFAPIDAIMNLYPIDFAPIHYDFAPIASQTCDFKDIHVSSNYSIGQQSYTQIYSSRNNCNKVENLRTT